MQNNITPRLTKLYLPEKEGERPLKRSMTGYELEMFLLDSNGNVTNADILLKKAQKLKIGAKRECTKSMVEVICLPHRCLRLTSVRFLETLQDLAELAEKEGYHLYPFGTYPGKNEPEFGKVRRYKIQLKIFGEEKFRNAGLVCGFHQHYTLPRGIFDHKTKSIIYKSSSKIRRTLLDSYNLLVALDPIVTLLLQSSPFVDNKYLAKDSRMLLFRGGKALRYSKGLYSKHQTFGGLQTYKQTLKDYIFMMKRRKNRWQRIMKKQNITTKFSDNILEYAWNPVKVNKKGTLECRGADANLLSNIFGVATMIKFALRKIQQDFTIVAPMDIDLEDSFKLENNMLFIPPHSVVRNKLQRDSAYRGFNSKELTLYTKNFYKFIKKEVFENYQPLLEPINAMINKKKTMSDRMLSRARRKGFSERITQDFAREMALHYSEEFYKEIRKEEINLDQ